jgi:MarR family transcriptional regulator, organic hydroperoxide resistance regulator
MREGGSLIAQAHRLGARVFARVLKERGEDELNPAQGRILYELWKEDGLQQGELARRTKLDKSSLALALDRMESELRIRRESVEGDARRRTVFLSAATKRMKGAYDAASAEMIGIFYAGMGAKEIDAFEASLRRVIANLEAAESGRR